MMMLLCVALMLASGGALGWCAHRAYLRMDASGNAMYKQDAIDRSTSEEEIDGALRRMHVLHFEDAAKTSRVRVAAK